MLCNRCGSETKVVESREKDQEQYRRRQCLNKKDIACGRRFSTYEQERENKRGD